MNEMLYRSFEVDSARIDAGRRSVGVSFSSEVPVDRWGVKEILLHGKENVDLNRIKKMGSALLNHNPNIIVGRLSGIRIDEDRKGRAEIIFDDDDEGNRAFRKIQSGSLKGVSVGYRVDKYREVQKDEEWEGFRGPALIGIRWTPYEISLTPIPADGTVGVGRSILDGIEIERRTEEMTHEEIKAMLEENDRRMQERIDALTSRIDANMEEREPQIRVSGKEYSELLARASAISPEAERKFASWVAEGKTGPELQRNLLDLATLRPDAEFKGTDSPEGDGIPDKKERVLDEISDEDFIRALTNPTHTIE